MNGVRKIVSKMILLSLVWVGSAGISHTSVYAGEPTGVWKGEWRSGSTGHHGPMRAVVKPNNNGGFDARFTGRFAVVIPFTYKTTLQPKYNPATGQNYLYSSKSLGPLLGSYTMHASVNEPHLNGSFNAVGDVGTIRMHRLR